MPGRFDVIEAGYTNEELNVALNDVFKLIEVGLISLWSLAFALRCLEVADPQAAGRVMGLSLGLALAASLAWWVVS
jgi:hypothetical protein